MVGLDAALRERGSDGTEPRPSALLPALGHSLSSHSSLGGGSSASSRSSPSLGAPPTTSTNSPRGVFAPTHARSDESGPRLVSSNFFVNSREIDAGRSPSSA